jgi:UDP-N-acetylglucosamine acyltransferase
MTNTSIHPDAKLGKDVTVSPFAVIYANVEIGDGTWIGPHTTIMDGARIGKNCKIFPGAVISAIPQDLKFAGEETTAEIGDNTTIRECVTVNRGTKHRMKTVVGSNCLLMAYTHIAHDCCIGNNVILANTVNLAGHVVIDDYATLEGLVAVQQFIHIGAHSFITGGSLVRKNVPPFVKAAREPLAYMGINSVGLKRRGFSSDTILHIEDIYRTIYQKNYNISNALSIVEKEFPPSAEKESILKFIRESKDGIIGPSETSKYKKFIQELKKELSEEINNNQ